MKQSKWSFPYAHDEGIWGSGGTVPLILNLGTGWSGSCQCCCTPGKEPPELIALDTGWPPRAGLDTLKNRKISCPSWELNHNSSGSQPVVRSLQWPHSSSSIYYICVFQKDCSYIWCKMYKRCTCGSSLVQTPCLCHQLFLLFSFM